MNLKSSLVLFALGAGACAADSESTATTSQGLSATDLRQLDAGGTATSIYYGWATPPDPDTNPPEPDADPPEPDLELLFARTDLLGRMSEYPDVAGGRVVRMKSRPAAKSETDPPQPDLEMSIYGRDSQLAGNVTVTPPEPDLGDATPPEPDHVIVRVQLQKSATVEVYDADGRLLGSLGAR